MMRGNMRHGMGALCALTAAAIALSSCGARGGGTTSVLPAIATSAPAPASSGKAAVSVSVTIDNAADKAAQMIHAHRVASSSSRSAQFVSPSTLGISIAATASGSTTPTTTAISAASGSPSCTSGTPRTCTLTLAVAPGTYAFALTTFDQSPNAGGTIPTGANVLGIANIPSQTIALDQPNNVSFLIDGMIAGLSFTGGAAFKSLPADGATHSVGVGVIATDADGNGINAPTSTPFANPITVTLAETGGSGLSSLTLNGTNVGASATIAHSTDTLTVQYNGGGNPGYSTTTTLSASGATSSKLAISPLYVAGAVVSGHALSFTGAAPVAASLTASEASAPSTVSYTQSLTTGCSTFVSGSGGGSGATAPVTLTANVEPFSLSGCSVTIQDNLGSAVTLPITLPTPTQECASAPLGTQVDADDVSSGSPCGLTVDVTSLTLFVSPSMPNTLAFNVGEANDTNPITINESQCAGVASFSASSIAGAANLASTTAGNVSATAITGNTACNVTITDGNGQTAIVAVTVDPATGSGSPAPSTPTPSPRPSVPFSPIPRPTDITFAKHHHATPPAPVPVPIPIPLLTPAPSPEP